jgi:hypothetical protein
MSDLDDRISGCDLNLEGDLIVSVFVDMNTSTTKVHQKLSDSRFSVPLPKEEMQLFLTENQIDLLKRYLAAKQILDAENKLLRVPIGVGRGGMEAILEVKEEELIDLERKANLKKLSKKFGL